MRSTNKLDLAISIINYRTAEMTIACVESVLPQIEALNARIVIVDNASGDGSIEKLETFIDQQSPTNCVTLIAADSNTGFSGGHNHTFRSIDAELYFVLNSDALLRKDCISTLLKKALIQPDTGLFAPKLEWEDGTPQVSCFRFASPLSELIRAAETGPVTRLLKRFDQPLNVPPNVDDIDWASFAAILIRREVIAQVGLMDEDYFLYFEDTDFCFVAAQKGWSISYVPDAKVVHFRGGSAPVKSLSVARKRLPAYYYASRTRYFAKAYGRFGLFAANVLWHVGRGIAASRILVGASYPKSVANEARDIWTNFLTPFKATRAPDDT